MLYMEPTWTVRVEIDFGAEGRADCSVVEVSVQAVDRDTAIARGTKKALAVSRPGEIRGLLWAEEPDPIQMTTEPAESDRFIWVNSEDEDL